MRYSVSENGNVTGVTTVECEENRKAGRRTSLSPGTVRKFRECGG